MTLWLDFHHKALFAQLVVQQEFLSWKDIQQYYQPHPLFSELFQILRFNDSTKGTITPFVRTTFHPPTYECHLARNDALIIIGFIQTMAYRSIFNPKWKQLAARLIQAIYNHGPASLLFSLSIHELTMWCYFFGIYKLFVWHPEALRTRLGLENDHSTSPLSTLFTQVYMKMRKPYFPSLYFLMSIVIFWAP